MSATVLCIDDQVSGLQIRKIFLESFGYKVLLASSGREGLELLNGQPVDAVVLDYRMPEMDGEAVAVEIRNRALRIPIVLLSGYISEIPESLQQHVNGFVAKGSPPEDLLNALEKALGSKPEKNGVRPKLAITETRHQAELAREHLAKTANHLKVSKKIHQDNAEHLQNYKRRTGG